MSASVAPEKGRLSDPAATGAKEQGKDAGKEETIEEEEADDDEEREEEVSELSREAAAALSGPAEGSAAPDLRAPSGTAAGPRRTLRLAVSMPGLGGEAGSALVSVPAPPPAEQRRHVPPAASDTNQRQKPAEPTCKKVGTRNRHCSG